MFSNRQHQVQISSKRRSNAKTKVFVSVGALTLGLPTVLASSFGSGLLRCYEDGEQVYRPTGHRYQDRKGPLVFTCDISKVRDVTYPQNGKHCLQSGAFDEELHSIIQRKLGDLKMEFPEKFAGAGVQKKDSPEYFYNGSDENPFKFSEAPAWFWSEVDLGGALYWPGRVIQMRQRINMDAEGNPQFGQHYLEDFPHDFGYITVFKLDKRFYRDGGRVYCDEWNHQDAPVDHTDEYEIFAREGYKKCGFKRGKRDAYIFNTGCFQNARMHPVLMMKIVNPYGIATEQSSNVPELVRRLSGGNPHGSLWDTVRRSLTTGLLGVLTRFLGLSKTRNTGMERYDVMQKLARGVSSKEIVAELSHKSLWSPRTIAKLTRTLSDMAAEIQPAAQQQPPRAPVRAVEPERSRLKVRLQGPEPRSTGRRRRKRRPRARRQTGGLVESTNGMGYIQAKELRGRHWRPVRNW